MASAKFHEFLNRLDINKDGKVDIEDATRAWEYVNGEVSPHGWLWTVGVFSAGMVLGSLIGKFLW